MAKAASPRPSDRQHPPPLVRSSPAALGSIFQLAARIDLGLWLHGDAASRAAPLRDALGADDAEAALPYELLYARLAARAGLAAAVAPIVSVHLAPWPAGRCAPHAAALPAALRAVLCV